MCILTVSELILGGNMHSSETEQINIPHSKFFVKGKNITYAMNRASSLRVVSKVFPQLDCLTLNSSSIFFS